MKAPALKSSEATKGQVPVTEPTGAAQTDADATAVERKLPQRGVHKDTGLMEWLASKEPEVEGAPLWKYPLDTV
jgi:hypothetical protein